MLIHRVTRLLYQSVDPIIVDVAMINNLIIHDHKPDNG